MNRMKKRILLGVLILALLLAGLFGFRALMNAYYAWHAKDIALPSEGTYVCEELGITMGFNGGSSYFEIDGKHILLSPSNAKTIFTTPNGEYKAKFHWDQERDVIMLNFTKAPRDLNLDVWYCFTREDDSEGGGPEIGGNGG